MSLRATATLLGLGVADLPDSFVTRPLPSVELTFEGLANDRHAGPTMKAGVRQPWFPKGAVVKNTRQLSVVGAEELEHLARELAVPGVQWQLLGANLCLSGLPRLTALPPSSRLLFPSGASVVIDSVNQPCRGPGRRLQQALGADEQLPARFVKAAMGRRGLVGWVERPGPLHVGDVIEVLMP